FAIISIIGLIIHIFIFIMHELKELTVTEKEIRVKYIFSKKTEIILYDEIIKFSTKRRSMNQTARITPGYQELEITLTNNRTLTFDENQYDNYNEVKINIYKNKKTPH